MLKSKGALFKQASFKMSWTNFSPLLVHFVAGVPTPVPTSAATDGRTHLQLKAVGPDTATTAVPGTANAVKVSKNKTLIPDDPLAASHIQRARACPGTPVISA